MEPDELLDKAANHLEKYGWVKDSYINLATSSACAIGALGAILGDPFVVNLTDDEKRLVAHAGTALLAEAGIRFLNHQQLAVHALDLVESHLTEWNDKSVEDGQQVIDLMRHAAKRVKEETDGAE